MPKNPPAYLRMHSYYGFLQSLLSPEDMVQLAIDHGITSLGLTDHRFLTGALSFYQNCLTAEIKPILGLEVDILLENGLDGQLTLFAQNQTGWANLARLSSQMLIEQASISLDFLSNHKQGLIAVSGGYNSICHHIWENKINSKYELQNYLKKLRGLFGKDLFIEIQRSIDGPLAFEPVLLENARQLSLPLIATQNIFYAHPEDLKTHKTLTAIHHNTTLQGCSRRLLPAGAAHFPDPIDFEYRFRDLPEAIQNLKIIEEKCCLTLPLGKNHFPAFPTPQKMSQIAYLKQSAFQGAKEIYKTLTPEIRTRLTYELNIIEQMGYAPIFLIVQDILKFARKKGIPTSSRGSAASSLVAHCLKITSPDPMALNLYFERFLNPARKKPPDIDTDIASHRRDEVIQYVFDKYGHDHTAMVCTINRYRPKSALSDVAKAFGLTPEAIRQLSKKLPSSFRYQHKKENQDPFDVLLREKTIPIIRDIVQQARQLLDLPRHLSVHPGGVIIAPFPITNLIPLAYSATLNIHHTQFDLDGIEQLGMVKIDLLGIKGLTVLGEVADRIQTWRAREFKSGLEVLDHIPLDDPATAETIRTAKTIGCFQIESPGMRATLREIQAGSVEDIMAALALYRPGPLRGGLRDAFVRRFKGEEAVEHIHPSLESLLGQTFGVILYQEQVLRIAHELGGLTLAQADILRRAMSHFDPGDMMKTLRENFVKGAAKKRSVPHETALRIWEMMAAFAGYGFPKAHAASYAQLAWYAAWCKTHHPAEFMAAVLGFGGGYYSQRVYLMEARRLGLTIHAPHINHSGKRFRVTYPKGEPTLYMGLDQVKELSEKTIQRVIQNRPYSSLEDFLIRVNPHKKEAQHLIMCGALENLVNIPDGLDSIEHERPPGQLNLFNLQAATPDWPQEKKIAAQRAILGVSLMMSPMEEYADQINAAGAISTLEALSLTSVAVTVAGMRQTCRRLRTKRGHWMCFMTLEDLEGGLSVMVPPDVYRKSSQKFKSPGPFIISGVMEQVPDQPRPWLKAKKIICLT